MASTWLGEHQRKPSTPLTRRVKHFQWFGIVEGDTGEDLWDPGHLPLVSPVTLHLTPSKSVGKQKSYGGKSEIRCQIPDKVQDERDTAYTFGRLVEVDFYAFNKLDRVKMG